jgi:hypothetical protein
MRTTSRQPRQLTAGVLVCVCFGATLALANITNSRAVGGEQCFGSDRRTRECAPGAYTESEGASEIGGSGHWVRIPDEEKRHVIGLYNRWCIRCHGVDGRGVWDIPGMPNFTNPGWQAPRTDDQLARSIIEGKGAVMPPFRSAITLDESWALVRYLRTFVPGTEVSRPDFGKPAEGAKGAK